MNKKIKKMIFIAILFCGFGFTVFAQPIENLKIFPNPANKYFIVSFRLETDSHIKIELFNVLSEKVFDIYEGFLEAGTYLETVITDSIENIKSGVYFLVFSVAENIIAACSFIITKDVSIEETIKNRAVNIFPNPTVSAFTVNFELEKSCNMKIMLCDILGKEIMQIYDGFATVGNFTETVNTENLTSGIYFLKIFIDGKYTIEKIVVE